MEVGEAVSVPQFLNDDVHNEKTCPWHADGKKKAKKMAPTDPDDDSSAMAPNDGGTLGQNLKKSGYDPPSVDEVWIRYKTEDEPLYFKSGRKKKEVRIYKKTRAEVPYDLQYAPHHLIPGNESLKGNAVVCFLGDDPSIEEFKGGQSSVIKEGFSTGYDVNLAENGVWLPSPYALSMKNEWPSAPGINVIKKRKGIDLAETTESFKHAYVAESIEETGRQFHMRHKEYSTEVQNILGAIAERLFGMAFGNCPIAEDSNDGDDKVDPPPGLPGRLHVLSANLRTLVTGKRWQPPIFVDELTQQYADDLKTVKAQARLTKVL
jgi:hypothetical protein